MNRINIQGQHTFQIEMCASHCKTEQAERTSCVLHFMLVYSPHSSLRRSSNISLSAMHCISNLNILHIKFLENIYTKIVKEAKLVDSLLLLVLIHPYGDATWRKVKSILTDLWQWHWGIEIDHPLKLVGNAVKPMILTNQVTIKWYFIQANILREPIVIAKPVQTRMKVSDLHLRQ